VKLPARDSWAGFAALVGCIVACVVLALLFVRKALPSRARHGAAVFGGIRDGLVRVNARRDDSRQRDDRSGKNSVRAARA
jgi:Sec-independent protein translocase protein TatA